MRVLSHEAFLSLESTKPCLIVSIIRASMTDPCDFGCLQSIKLYDTTQILLKRVTISLLIVEIRIWVPKVFDLFGWKPCHDLIPLNFHLLLLEFQELFESYIIH